MHDFCFYTVCKKKKTKQARQRATQKKTTTTKETIQWEKLTRPDMAWTCLIMPRHLHVDQPGEVVTMATRVKPILPV